MGLFRKRMNLIESYKKIRTSIVAFTCKYELKNSPEEPDPAFPHIIGTGFIVDSDGLIATNHHVIQAFQKVWRPKDVPKEDWGVTARLFHLSDKGMMQVPLEIIGAGVVRGFLPGGTYYGPVKPDIGIVHVKARQLPTCEIEEKPFLIEGIEVATAGFPMGRDALMAPGWLHQLSPTLQRGIVSALLPFHCENYHAYTINIMTQGGASGSPVFLPDSGRIVGILYAGLEESQLTTLRLPEKIKKALLQIEPSLHMHIFSRPTNISYVVPSHYIVKSIEQVKKNNDFSIPKDAKTIDEMIKTMPIENAIKKVEKDRKEIAGDFIRPPEIKEVKIDTNEK